MKLSRINHHGLTVALLIALTGFISGSNTVSAQDLPLCHMVATGGTIAMKLDPLTNAPVPALSGEDLIASVPGLDQVARIQVESPFNVPSTYMDPERWVATREAVAAALDNPEVAGVIVSHGTDTLEETAWFLDLTVNSDKPIILVGAQRNASEPDSDGPRNLLNAARVCIADQAKGKGAMIVMNGQINAAREVTKTHTSDVETFKSGDFGFLGNVDPDRVIFYREPLRRQFVAVLDQPLPRVDIIPMYAGADGMLLHAAISAGARGVVIEAAGMGNINIPLFEAIKEAIAGGITVVISTRVPNGRVLPMYGFAGGGKTLQDAGAIFADNLSAQKARILLMLGLQATTDPEQIQLLFDR
jgi:L-asparaginase